MSIFEQQNNQNSLSPEESGAKGRIILIAT